MQEFPAICPRTAGVLERGIAQGWHPGAQFHLSIKGETLADWAVGQAAPGVPMTPHTLLLWLSSVKPVTAVAVAQLREARRLDWDDPVARYLPEFSQGGKSGLTIRHLLTHTAGFRTADRISEHVDWAEMVTRICQAPLEPGWVPGRDAGYQMTSSWTVLGEMVSRIDGRPIDRYVREMIFEPLGMRDSWLCLSSDQFRSYGPRLGQMFETADGRHQPHPLWNTEQGCAVVRPGGSGRGPIRELGLFYQALWRIEQASAGPAGLAREQAQERVGILRPETVREMRARHRVGLTDRTLGRKLDWGLGFVLNPAEPVTGPVPYGFGSFTSPQTFGHSGSQSSSAFLDPATGLVVAWVCNGRPGEQAHQRRVREIHQALGEDLGECGRLYS